MFGPRPCSLPAEFLARAHLLGEDCWCRPTVEEHPGVRLVVHNSTDGREAYETGQRQPH